MPIPTEKATSYLAMNMVWKDPASSTNWCHTCKTPLIEYWISGEDGKAHLQCDYFGVSGEGQMIGSFHGSNMRTPTEQAKEVARKHYARMIYPDADLGRYLFKPLPTPEEMW